MAKDDLHVLIYYILKYLYACAKEGIGVREEVIRFKEYPVEVNEDYAEFVLITMLDEGFIKGIDVISVAVLGKGRERVIKDLSYISITLKGVEYLNENSAMQKAYESLKKFKDLIPFI